MMVGLDHCFVVFFAYLAKSEGEHSRFEKFQNGQVYLYAS